MMKTPPSTSHTLRLLLAAGLLASVAGSSLAQQTLYTPSPIRWRNNATGNDGGFFTTGSGAVLVSHLGYCSTNTITGLNQSHAVGLFTSGTPYVPVVTNTVPAGTSAYWYKDFYWVQLDQPLLLAPNTKYYLWGYSTSGDGDWWKDEPGNSAAGNNSWNSYFVGSQGTGTRACMWGAGSSWPPSGGGGGTGWCLNRYYSKAMIGNLPAGQAKVLYTGPTNLNVNGLTSFTLSSYAVGETPTYQWWHNGVAIPGATSTSYTVPSAWDTNSGTYYFTATNTVNDVTSGQQTPNINVSVIINPVIRAAAPPTAGQKMTLYTGASATFALTTMAGAAPFSYQWYADGVADSNGTNASYSLSEVQSSSPTTYTCIVTNLYGAATNTWTIAVVAPPTQPYPATVLADAPVGYWRLNEPDNHANNGNYHVVANDYWGGNSGVYSNTLLGHVGYGSGLASQYGYTPATDSETGAQFGNFPSGGPTNSYAGDINGVSFAAPKTETNAAFSVEAWVNGATNQILGAGIVTKGYGNGGEQFDLDYYNGYRFLMRDAAGGVHSYTSTIKTDGNWHHLVGVYDSYNSNVLLYVDGQLKGKSSWATASNGVLSSSAPLSIGARRSSSTSDYDLQFAGTINDVALYNYALSPAQVFAHYAAAGIGAHFTQTPPSAVNLNYGDTLRLPATTDGTPTVTHQWYDITTGLPGTPVPNQTNATLVMENVDSTYSGHTLALKTRNDYGQAITAGTFINVYTNPVFTLQPVPALTLYAGSSATIPLSVSTIGPSPIGYIWSANGVPIAFTTNGTVSITNPQSGTYTCQATNALGSTMSSATTVTVVPAPTAPYPAAVLGDHPLGYWRLNESDDGNGNTGRVVNDYWGGNYGFYTNTLLGQTGYSQGLAIQSGYPSATEPAVTSPNFGYSPSYPATSNYVGGIPNINFAATNQSVAFSIEAWAKGDTAQGDLKINGGAIVAKGGWAAEQFTLDTGGSSYAYRVTMRDAQNNMRSASSAACLPDGNWHHLVGVLDQANSNLCLYVDGVKVASTLLPAATNGVLGTPVPVSIGSRLNSGGAYAQQFLGNINDVAIYNYALSSNQVVSHFLAAGIPPRFTLLPPGYTNVNENTTLSIPVQVLGSAPLSCQWYDTTLGSPGTPVPGQTSPTLVISNISFSAHNYHTFALTAVNSYGQATTSPGVFVAVQTGPPSGVTVTPAGAVSYYAGQPVVFTATGQGSQPFSYQWSLDGTPISGATQSSYTNIVALDNHLLGCTVSNPSGVGSPAPATVYVTGVAAPTDSYARSVLTAQPLAYWRLGEAAYSGLAYDYVGGHNATYSSAVNGLPGFNPLIGDTATQFGSGAAYYSMALEANQGYGSGIPTIDFSAPEGDNGHFSIELWVNAPAGQKSSAGVIAKGYGGGGEQFNLDVYTGGHYRFFVRNALGVTSTIQSPNIGPDGTWHHLVAVCDQANGQLALYVDGVLNATADIVPDSGVLGALPVGAPVLTSIGSRMVNSTDYNFSNQLTNAVIDEVALYDYVLSPSTVAAHYAAAGQSPVIYGQPAPAISARYEGIPAQYTVSASGAAPLAYQWRKDGQPIDAATGIALNFSSPVAADTGSYDVVVTNAYGATTSSVVKLTIVAPSSGYENQVLANGPLNYWRLNETNGTIAYDYLGGLNGTYGANATNGVPGPSDPIFSGFESNNTAVAIDVTASTAGAGYVTAPTIPLNTNTVTMICWVYPFADITTYEGVVYCGANPIIKGLAYVPASGLNYIGYTWNSNAPNTYGGTACLPTPPRQWSFVALTIAPNQAILYVGTNGVLRAATNNIAHDVEPFSNPTCIGADPRFAPSSGRVFNGKLDEVAIYGTTLSGDQVANLYSAATVPPAVTLTVQRSGANLLLSWPNGTLMAAPTVDGPWTNVPNATAPSYLVTPTDGQLFYRVRVR